MYFFMLTPADEKRNAILEVGLNSACNSLDNQAFMAILNILHYPDERLHTVARPVVEVDDRIRQLIDDMADTMYAAPGIGLAATQVDVHEQVIVIDISEDRRDLRAFINPRIVTSCGTQKVTVEALDRNGQKFTLEADGLLAVCIQHEIDHLKGKVFVEYLSQFKQGRIKNKLKKRLRETM